MQHDFLDFPLEDEDSIVGRRLPLILGLWFGVCLRLAGLRLLWLALARLALTLLILSLRFLGLRAWSLTLPLWTWSLRRLRLLLVGCSGCLRCDYLVPPCDGGKKEENQ